jgi:multiple sugar transport system substrate-binding protein
MEEKRMSKKLSFALAILMMASLMLASCAPAATPVPTQAPAAAQPTAKEPVTVRILHMQQAGPTPDENNAIAAEFNKNNPDIKVVIDYVAYDALHDKIVTSMAVTPPSYDAFLMDDGWYGEFQKAGYLLDVTDKITQDMKDKVFKSAWGVTTVGDKIYGLPYFLDTKYFYYNEELLKQAGFNEPPKTWEEMLDMAKVIKEKNIVEFPIVWSWAQKEAAICDWVVLLTGDGGTMMDASGKPAFNSDKGVETLTWMVKSIDDKLSNPASVADVEDNVVTVMQQGKAVFALNWLYMANAVNFNEKDSKVVGKIKIALMPVFKSAAAAGLKSTSINGSMGMSVAAGSAHPEETWKFITYLGSEDVMNKYSANLLPFWATSFEGDAGKALVALSPVNAMTVPAFQMQFPYAVTRPHLPYYQEASLSLQLAMQEALTKSKTPKQALDEAAAKWIELGSK